jgi:hypothetical protein
MKNAHNLPEPILALLKRDDYDRGSSDWTTTELIRPVRIVSLFRKWRKQIEEDEDAIDKMWMLWGQILHTLFEQAAIKCGIELVERRFYIERLGRKIGGRVDLLNKRTLIDWKETKVFHFKEPKTEWVQQANINRLLCEENDQPVDKIEYWARYRNWDKIQASRKQDYPPPLELFNIPIWPKGQTEAYLAGRIKAHEMAKENPPICLPEERWRQPDQFALMKRGRKIAVKLYDTYGEAISAAAGNGANYVQERPGQDTRCLFYCNVAPYCSFYQELMQEKHQ